MADNPAHLTLKLDTDEPIELGNFVGAFTSIANEFERYIDETYPGTKATPEIFVREVRKGCIEADLSAGLVTIATSAVTHMDQILILEDFVRRWGRRMTALISNTASENELNTPSQLNDFLRAAEAIAADPIASHKLEAAEFEDGERKVRAFFRFTSFEARTAQQDIEDRKKLISAPSSEIRQRVLMVYTRTDVHDAQINKKSGERVVINSVSPNEYAVMYASEMVEQEMRQQIREVDENAFKKGFVVDVAVQTVGERIVAYSVTAFHQSIDLD